VLRSAEGHKPFPAARRRQRRQRGAPARLERTIAHSPISSAIVSNRSTSACSDPFPSPVPRTGGRGTGRADMALEPFPTYVESPMPHRGEPAIVEEQMKRRCT
jgi:hypothetical protein